MKLLALVLVLSASSAAAAADTWQVQHLAYHGGTRALIVSRADRQFAEAFIRNEEKMGVYIGCFHKKDAQTNDLFETYLAIGNGNPFAGPEMEIAGYFDENHQVMLGRFSYARGRYWTALRPQHLAWFSSSEGVTLRSRESALDVRYSLDGAIDALKQISCQNV